MNHFPDYEIVMTVVIKVNGSDYDAADWDNDQAEFEHDMKQEAVENLRHSSLDMVVADVAEMEQV